MKIDKALIICPTYKESFTFRRALIDLGINWSGYYGDEKDSCKCFLKWRNLWNHYKKNTVYCIENNKLQYCNYEFFFNEEDYTYKDYIVYSSVNEFVKRYIMLYGK